MSRHFIMEVDTGTVQPGIRWHFEGSKRKIRLDSEVRSTAPNTMPDYFKNVIFWTKLLTGAIFGVLSYFIMRFYQVLTFFVVIPTCAVLAIMITLFVIERKARSIGIELTSRKALGLSLWFSSTWIMAFLALASLTYFLGW